LPKPANGTEFGRTIVNSLNEPKTMNENPRFKVAFANTTATSVCVGVKHRNLRTFAQNGPNAALQAADGRTRATSRREVKISVPAII
jgi:hypothetical protein